MQNGLPKLVAWLSKLQIHEHSPKIPFELCLGTGSQDVLTKAFDMLIESNDSLLIEAPAYVGSLAYLKPLGCNLIEIEVDKDGIVPEKLDHILTHWDNGKMII